MVYTGHQEVSTRSLTELLPAIYALLRQEKFRLMQELLTDLAQEDGIPEGEYPVWSPSEAHKAAATLMRMLEEEKEQAA